jgi:hypothetical protein
MFSSIKDIFIANKFKEKTHKLKVLEKSKKKIVNNFEERCLKQADALDVKPENRIVLGAVFDKLEKENTKKDYRISLNIQYQRGLLHIREKNYEKAISFFANGLIFLLYKYNVKFDTTLLNGFKEERSNLHQRLNQLKNEINDAQVRFVKQIQKCIIEEKLTRKEFVKNFLMHSVDDEIKNKIDIYALLRELNLFFSLDFFDIDFGKNIALNQIEIHDFEKCKNKLLSLTQYLLYRDDSERLKATVQSLYRLGILHEQCFGSYLLFCEKEVKLIIQNFKPDKYSYDTKKIIYNKVKYYYQKMQKNYIKHFGKEINIPFNIMDKRNELLDFEDYSLINKYL